jgi:hypothetical protein
MAESDKSTDVASHLGAQPRSFPFARRTGQLGKARLALALVMLGGAAVWVSHQFMEHDWWMTLDLAGVAVFLVGLIWLARSVVCPSCNAKLCWMAMNGKAKGLAALEACPRCGYKPPPTPEELAHDGR